MSAASFQDIQYKASSGQVNLDQAQGIVECFVAGIGNKDSVGDVCATGAFAKSLLRRKPRVVWGHNWNDPIGKVLEIYEVPPSDPRLPAKMRAAGIGGLYAKVQFNLNSEKGREAFANVAFFGEEQEWSIGYKTIRSQFDQSAQANILYEVELYEVSPVLHGANQLTGTISVKNAEKGGTSVMPMPSGPQDMPEDDIQRKLQEELEARIGSAVKVESVEDDVVMYSREGDDEKGGMYKCRFHHDGGVFMFGRPERVQMPMTPMAPAMPKPQPQQMPTGMPSKPMEPVTGVIVVPQALPQEGESPKPAAGAGQPSGKPKLVQEEADLAEALIKITKRHGKFDEDGSGVWAGYKPAAQNPVAKIGVKCSNCVLYQGNGVCKIIAQKVEDDGKCRFAVMPDNVVVASPIKKQEVDSAKQEEEVKWLQEIEAKHPEEFLSGDLRMALKRKRDAVKPSVKMIPIQEFSSKSLESSIDEQQTFYYLPVDKKDAFEVKQTIDPIIDYYRTDAYVEDGGIIFTAGVNKDFADAIDNAVKALGRNLAGKLRRGGRGLSARFDPKAWDGDNDGIVQEGTPFERPAIPGVNDFSTRGRVDTQAATRAYRQQGGGKRRGKPEKPAQRREGMSSGRSLTRHSDGATNPRPEEVAKRDAHEKLIDAWEKGMGMRFTPIPRQPSEKGGKFTPDWLRGRELGYNDAKARWAGKGNQPVPKNFNENQRQSTNYASWFMNVAGQLGQSRRSRGNDNMDQNDGMDAGMKEFLLSVMPQTQTRETQDAIEATLRDAGLSGDRRGLSSGRSGLSSGRRSYLDGEPEPDYEATNEYEWDEIPSDVQREIAKDIEEYILNGDRAAPDNVARAIDEDGNLGLGEEATIIEEDGVKYVATPATSQAELLEQIFASDRFGYIKTPDKEKLIDSMTPWRGHVQNALDGGQITDDEAGRLYELLDEIESEISDPSDKPFDVINRALGDIEKITKGARERLDSSVPRPTPRDWEYSPEGRARSQGFDNLVRISDSGPNNGAPGRVDSNSVTRLMQNWRDRRYSGQVSKDGKYEITPLDEFAKDVINGGELDYEVDYDYETGEFTTVSDPAYIWTEFDKFSNRPGRSGMSSGRRWDERGIDYRQGDPETAGFDLERVSQRSDDLGANFRHLLREVPEGDPVVFEYRGKLRQVRPQNANWGSASMKVSKDGAIYFGGIDAESGEFRTFRLDRINGLIQGADYGGYDSGWDGGAFRDELPRALRGMSSGRMRMTPAERQNLRRALDEEFAKDQRDFRPLSDEINKRLESLGFRGFYNSWIYSSTPKADDLGQFVDVAERTAKNADAKQRNLDDLKAGGNRRKEAVKRIFAKNKNTSDEELTSTLREKHSDEIYNLYNDEFDYEKPWNEDGWDSWDDYLPEDDFYDDVLQVVADDLGVDKDSDEAWEAIRDLDEREYINSIPLDALVRVFGDRAQRSRERDFAVYEIAQELGIPLSADEPGPYRRRLSEDEFDRLREISSGLPGGSMAGDNRRGLSSGMVPNQEQLDAMRFRPAGQRNLDRINADDPDAIERLIDDVVSIPPQPRRSTFSGAGGSEEADRAIGQNQFDKLQDAINVHNALLDAYKEKFPERNIQRLSDVEGDMISDDPDVAYDIENMLGQLEGYIDEAWEPFIDSSNRVTDIEQERERATQTIEDLNDGVSELEADTRSIPDELENGDITIDEAQARRNRNYQRIEQYNNEIDDLRAELRNLDADEQVARIFAERFDEAQALMNSRSRTARDNRRARLSSGRRAMEDAMDGRAESEREAMLDAEERDISPLFDSFMQRPVAERARAFVNYRKETGQAPNPDSASFRRWIAGLENDLIMREDNSAESARDMGRGLSSGRLMDTRRKSVSERMFDDYVSLPGDLSEKSDAELAREYGTDEATISRLRTSVQREIDQVVRDLEDYYGGLPGTTDEEFQAMADDYARRGLSSGRNRKKG